MSQENVELFLESMRRAGTNDVDGFAALLHPEIRSTGVREWPEPGPYVGRDEVVAQAKRNLADWDEVRLTHVEVVADEGEWVVAELLWEARGAGSGVETDAEMVAAIRVEDSLITEWHFRWTRAEALEAAGLSE